MSQTTIYKSGWLKHCIRPPESVKMLKRSQRTITDDDVLDSYRIYKLLLDEFGKNDSDLEVMSVFEASGLQTKDFEKFVNSLAAYNPTPQTNQWIAATTNNFL